ncbi:MAG: hypothetical protein C00003105_01592 [ANME-2 cluster archaeon HR1]|nr:MAG: hypothetical protein C00003105_01592 [ANME-2 cluster archaeon HR1]
MVMADSPLVNITCGARMSKSQSLYEDEGENGFAGWLDSSFMAGDILGKDMIDINTRDNNITAIGIIFFEFMVSCSFMMRSFFGIKSSLALGFY